MPTTVKTYSAQETMNSYSGTRLSIVNLAGAFDSLPTVKVLRQLEPLSQTGLFRYSPKELDQRADAATSTAPPRRQQTLSEMGFRLGLRLHATKVDLQQSIQPKQHIDP